MAEKNYHYRCPLTGEYFDQLNARSLEEAIKEVERINLEICNMNYNLSNGKILDKESTDEIVVAVECEECNTVCEECILETEIHTTIIGGGRG